MSEENKDTALLEKTEKALTALDGRTKLLADDAKKFQTNQEKVLGDISRLDTELKKALEDLTKAKNAMNDFDTLLKKMGEVQKQVALSARRNYGDPIERITSNEDFSKRINLAVRMLCQEKGELKAPIEILQKAVGEESGFATGYITPELAKEIYDLISQYGIWRNFYVENIGTRTAQIPVDTADPIAYALSEGTQIPDDSNIAGTTLTLNVKIIAVLLNVYRTLLEDAQYDVTGRVMRKFANAFAYRMDWFGLAAGGAANTTDGGFTGIFPGAVQVVAPTGHNAIANLTYDDIVKLLYSVSARVLHKNPKFFVHPFVLAQIMRIKDGQGRPIFLSYLEAPAFGRLGSLLGFPVVLADAAPSTDGVSKPVLSFGDPEGGYYALRSDFAFESSDHFKWDYFARSFRGVGRAAFTIRSDGNSTTKPFATLVTSAS
jgi:HK97 family phage major capsid protein